MTAPSHFLYFLPPRQGVDSAKKLRLISSSAHPSEPTPLIQRIGTTPLPTSKFWPAYSRHQPHSQLPSSYGLQTTSSDHFQAIPTSDGYHILFIDPSTGLLCLGSDAPLGGPTKLLRKIILLGPTGERPTMYASGSDLRWGVRIVAGYGDRLFLFSVPPDIFNDSRMTQTTHGEWRESSQAWSKGIVENEQRDGSLWPVRIRGAEFGRVSQLVDIAVNSGPAMAVWAFSAAGKAFFWEVDVGDPQQMAVRRRVMLREGQSVEVDNDGDIVMPDAAASEDLSELDRLWGHLRDYQARPQDGASDTGSISSLGPAPEQTQSTADHAHKETMRVRRVAPSRLINSMRVAHQQHSQTAFGWVSEYDEALWIQERTEYGVFAGDCVTWIDCDLV